LSTDDDWERWGARDPYYGVITRPEYRQAVLDEPARAAFFDSGRDHVNHVFNMCQRLFNGPFAPASALDFGCGVGRLLVPLAARIPRVMGMDIAHSMLAEARRNCDLLGAAGVSLVLSDDDLSAAPGQFDLVHSSIVLQHLEPPRGRRIFAALVDRVAPGGIGALHVTYAWDHFSDNWGQRPPPPPPPPTPPLTTARLLRELARRLWRRQPAARSPSIEAQAVPEAGLDPAMEMHFYNLSELLFVLRQRGVAEVHADLTDHGGALGAMLFFRRPR
jgi:SAM-dependent methyltransferase